MLGKEIGNILDSHAGLTALVGTNIFATIMPQSQTPPGVVYQIQSWPEYTKSGPAYWRAMVSVLIVAKDYATCLQIVEQVIAALDCNTGTFGSVQITSSRINDKIVEDYNDELGEHAHVIPFEVTYKKLTI